MAANIECIIPRDYNLINAHSSFLKKQIDDRTKDRINMLRNRDLIFRSMTQEIDANSLSIGEFNEILNGCRKRYVELWDHCEKSYLNKTPLKCQGKIFMRLGGGYASILLTDPIAQVWRDFLIQQHPSQEVRSQREPHITLYTEDQCPNKYFQSQRVMNFSKINPAFEVELHSDVRECTDRAERKMQLISATIPKGLQQALLAERDFKSKPEGLGKPHVTIAKQ